MLLSQPVGQGPAAGEVVDTRLLPAAREAVEGQFTSPLPADEVAADGKTYFPGVQPEHFPTIRDNTVFRGAEHKAFFNLLEVLKSNDQAALVKASTGSAAFVQLFRQPDEYRGQLVSLHGTVRRAFRIEASKNDLGIDHYYQLWIQPYDNPGMPLVAYSLMLPEGFPVGMQLQEDIDLTGFFFKLWAYKAQDSIRTTPLLLAKTVGWERPVAVSAAPSTWDIVSMVGAALAVAGLVVVFALRGSGPKNPYRGTRPPPAAWRSPEVADESPEEALRKLAETDTSGPAHAAHATAAPGAKHDTAPGPHDALLLTIALVVVAAPHLVACPVTRVEFVRLGHAGRGTADEAPPPEAPSKYLAPTLTIR